MKNIVLCGFCLVFFMVIFSGCATKNNFYPIDGAMDGRSYSFCGVEGERYPVPSGYICASIEHLRFQVATDGRYSKSEVEKGISELFEKTLVSQVQELYKTVGKNITYIGPLGTFPENERIYSPGEKSLRIEVHMVGREEFSNDGKDEMCRPFFILMITKDMYLRSVNNYCAPRGQFSETSFERFVVEKINYFIFKDLFYIDKN